MICTIRDLGLRIGAGAVAVMVATGSCADAGAKATPVLVGRRVPEISLAIGAAPVRSLRETLQGKPALITIIGVDDCLGCGQYATEVLVARNRFPGLTLLVVASGPDQAALRHYVHANHLDEYAAFDSTRAVVTALGRQHEPLTMLVGLDGTILFADSRIGFDRSAYPPARLLGDLVTALMPERGDHHP